MAILSHRFFFRFTLHFLSYIIPNRHTKLNNQTGNQLKYKFNEDYNITHKILNNNNIYINSVHYFAVS